MNKHIAFFVAILIFVLVFPVNVSAEEFQNTDEGELTTLEFKTEYIKGGPGQVMHIVFNSDRPVNLYIVKPGKTLYMKTGTAESDYFDDMDILESRLHGTSYDFKWEVPENRGYVLYIHNPGYGNVTYELKYTDPYYESMDDIIFYSIILIVIIAVIVIIIYIIKRRSRNKNKRKKKKQRKKFKKQR
jgi:hypothetical protein